MDWKIKYTTCSRIWLRGGNAGERAGLIIKLDSIGAEEQESRELVQRLYRSWERLSITPVLGGRAAS